MVGKVAESVLDLIGHTPLLHLSRFAPPPLSAIYAKIEWFNPGGSVKDRAALGMILDAEQRGVLGPGYTIIEPTAGNTGIGLALVGIARGYRVILCVPRGYSVENGAIAIHRLFWITRVSFSGLQAVYFDPDATRRSIRTFGNDGFFSFTGYFRNKELGSYRAFMTDRRRAVVIRFPASVIVISPERPENFVDTISQYKR